jgi:protease-4
MSQNFEYRNQPYYAPAKKKLAGWAVALIVCGIVLVTGILIVMVFAFFIVLSGRNTDKLNYSGSDGYVAILHIEGTITGTKTTSFLGGESTYDHTFLMDTVDQVMNDPDNVGILLYIDTPGGEVYATDELYLKLEEYQYNTERPIYAYCASMAASGGYYLAASADKIYMNRNCLTGSIGVTAGTTIDISGFLEKQGIEVTSIYVGENKTMGSYFEEFTPEQQEIYLTILRETYDQFVQVVADGRDMSIEEVEVLADGRIYSPKQGVANGLVDGIMSYDEARGTMVEACSLSDNVEFLDFLPSYDIGLSDLIGLLSGYKKTDLDTYLSYLDMPVDGPAYYYEGP